MSNNEILKDHIRERAARHGGHELFEYILEHIRLPVEKRFSQLNKFIVFSFLFSDMMGEIAKHYRGRLDALSAAIVEHCEDDMRHYRMLIEDYKERMGVHRLAYDDVESVLFPDEHSFMRRYAISMEVLCAQVIDRPVLLVCLLEAIEGSSQAMLAGYRPAAKVYEQHRGIRFRYLGEKHLRIEQSHKSLFDWVEVPDEDLDAGLEIITRHFDNAWLMLDGSMKCTLEYVDRVLEEAK